MARIVSNLRLPFGFGGRPQDSAARFGRKIQPQGSATGVGLEGRLRFQPPSISVLQDFVQEIFGTGLAVFGVVEEFVF